MNTAITEGVEIKVSTQFRPDLSQVNVGSFFFNYRVEIENHNNFPVKLLSRNWYIFDSLNDAEYVSGEGVIGEQPELKPEEQYHYTSGAELFSEVGHMKGFYVFQDLKTGREFEVNIPLFELVYPPKLN